MYASVHAAKCTRILPMIIRKHCVQHIPQIHANEERERERKETEPKDDKQKNKTHAFRNIHKFNNICVCVCVCVVYIKFTNCSLRFLKLNRTHTKCSNDYDVFGFISEYSREKIINQAKF